MDLQAAKGSMQNPELLREEFFGFCIQQTIEKLFKAWLASLDILYPLTTHLNILFARLEKADCDVSSYRELLKFAIFDEIQYEAKPLPEDWVSADREKVIAQVQRLYDFVEFMLEIPVVEDPKNG